ncbi:MAG: bifunctional histidinol-phosphatase/imidazoleglycerol-phosphate dehydratase HisB [Flavobacteriaceae bacterium]|nr:bifunctional histidinol-phosphatase/imidazoleglycerol-phosphate dehydratase HisB [Flavobacteriaceae bacterium]
MKKVLFVDRDGTLIKEPGDQQVDRWSKLEFYPGVLQYLPLIVSQLDYELVMVTNQDGLGTKEHPEENFWPIQNFIVRTLESQEVHFSEIFIDRSYPQDKLNTRKPGVGMLTKYIENASYNLSHSLVIGDRYTDMELAYNLGAKGIFLNNNPQLGQQETNLKNFENVISLTTQNWKHIFEYLKSIERSVIVSRITSETNIHLKLKLDGVGQCKVDTGIGFFDHMLTQLARHGGIDFELRVIGDLHIDEHHTIEDTAIVLGESFLKSLGNKMGIERYGFYLPMDDALAQVALDFGGRSWLVWDVEFKREKIGQMPTEMFKHFFKSFCDGAKANLNIKAEGENEHHKIEAIFKAFAKAIKMAVRRELYAPQLPTTKGIL